MVHQHLLRKMVSSQVKGRKDGSSSGSQPSTPKKDGVGQQEDWNHVVNQQSSAVNQNQERPHRQGPPACYRVFRFSKLLLDTHC